MASSEQQAQRPPRGILMILWGKQPFRKMVVAPGQRLTLGRGDEVDVVIPDPEMNPLHLQLWFSGARLEVRDLESDSGTAIDGEDKPRGVLEHGGFFTAGGTTFQFFVEARTPATDDPIAPERRSSLEKVRSALGPAAGLYAVVDAARSPRVRWLLQESVDEHQSLYEGVQGRSLDEVAPYLVRFSDDSDLVDRLLAGGWGDCWGIFFRSAAHPKEVRRHLRRFLMVRADEPHERLYFRYYDPRVMREFLPQANARQRADLLTGIDRLFVEGPDGALLTDEDLAAVGDRAGEGSHVSHS